MMPSGGGTFGARAGKREVIDVAERKPQDRRLDQLLHVRKQRLSRLERECNEARRYWREQRSALQTLRQRRREILELAYTQWTAARQAFMSMVITNGQFRKAKAVYERGKQEAAQLYLDCRQQAHSCRRAGTDFFEARQRVREANRQQEKLGILRDEMQALAMAQNTEA